MSRYLLILILLALPLVPLLGTPDAPRATSADDELRAGFAETDITPPLKDKTVFMAGFGHNRKAVGGLVELRKFFQLCRSCTRIVFLVHFVEDRQVVLLGEVPVALVLAGHGHEPTLDQIAAVLKIKPAEAGALRVAGRHPVSLNDALEGGDEQKSFHTRDGHGLVMLHRAGLRFGIISGRTPRLVVLRAADLGVAYVRQSALGKLDVFEQVLAEAETSPAEVAFVGDDVVDIPLMRRSGLAVAVADAGRDTREAAHYVTKLPGGFGAVREVCELILKAQGRWDELMKRYTG